MTSASLFPSVLGADFEALDPCVKRVHSGKSMNLEGTAAVERGASLIARALGAIASLPPAVGTAPIEVKIDASGRGERWIRIFPPSHRMVSTLHGDGELLVERLGPAVLKFRLSVRDGAMEWVLEHISACGIPLPRKWFRISATIDSRDGRYHFFVDSELRGVGRIVRYEGLLSIGPCVS
jgi:Domain of unknown function (DUF4166)